MMRISFILGVFLVFCLLGNARGQFASDCYYPQVGVPGVIDTIYGSYSGQKLGDDVFNPGPIARDGSRIFFIQGLPENPPFLTSLKIGTPFDLHNRQIAAKTAFSRMGIITEPGHFRDSKHTDLIAIGAANRDDPRIYWSDDDGNYDSINFTRLEIPERKGYYSTYSAINAGFPCHGHFTSDSVSDIIIGVSYNSDSLHEYKNYLAFYKGGAGLYEKYDTAFADSLEYYEGQLDKDVHRDIGVGNWRGSEKDDIVASSPRTGDWFYYKNETFSLKDLSYSLKYDTLLAFWQNPKIVAQHGARPIRGFSKQPGDLSVDLLSGFETSEPAGGASLFFYKGGKQFGSKRLFFDSVDYRFHTVRWYSSTYFGWYIESLYDVGDMTGTGNPVLHTFAGDANGNSHEFFYVMGAAMDDRVDMFYESSPYGAGPFDTLDANGDGRMDLIEGMYRYVTPEDISNGKSNVGSVHLVYGSNKIPVDVNFVREKFSSGVETVQVYPNPLVRSCSIKIPEQNSVELHVTLRNMLGESVFRKNTYCEHGDAKLEIPPLPSGGYVLEARSGSHFYRANVVVIK